MNEPNETELAIFCARDVMGWPIETHGNGDVIAHQPDGSYVIVIANHPWSKADFYPPTSPADAMAVLEKCAEKGREIGFGVIITRAKDCWHVGIFPDHDQANEACENTLEKSICRLAFNLFKKD